ncbi:hypothetical protein Scep_016889 [Stephania cephalantha]|uniref:Uncharacterized protein n=1 Tax=Stephania cephalantha TaxID=152367 RepID=A0AAP0NWD1_9MAGN
MADPLRFDMNTTSVTIKDDEYVVLSGFWASSIWEKRLRAKGSRSVHDKVDEENSENGFAGQPIEEGEFEADEADEEQIEENKFDEEVEEGEEEQNEEQTREVDAGDEEANNLEVGDEEFSEEEAMGDEEAN